MINESRLKCTALFVGFEAMLHLANEPGSSALHSAQRKVILSLIYTYTYFIGFVA